MISRTAPLSRILTPALALCLAAGAANAQSQTRDQDERDNQRQNQPDREDRTKVDENHPLWAHPVEGDWQPRDRWSQRPAGEAADHSRMDESYRVAYWEGYHDGFHDDEFGSEHWSGEWGRSYSSAYTEGYYDGYYDQQLDYPYDPNYYIYTVAVVPRDQDAEGQAERQRAEQRRKEDQMRARGDRMAATGSAAGTQLRPGDVEKIGALKLVRGDVTEITEAERSDHPDHTVLRISFKDREDIIADFGPQMTREELPFDRGDRVSLIGYHATSQQGETIVVSQINRESEFYKLRGAKETLEDRDVESRPRSSGG